MRIMWSPLFLVAVIVPVSAESVLVADIFIGAPQVVSVDLASPTPVRVTVNETGGYDMAVGTDRLLYTGATRGVQRGDLTGRFLDMFSTHPDDWDLAFRADGTLVAVDRAYAYTTGSGVAELGRDGSVLWADTIPGYLLWGLDVPRGGPFEDGIIAIASQEATGFYYLFRWRQDSLGAWQREGPLGPLDLADYGSCWSVPGFCALHPTVAADGLSFYTVEGALNRVQQFDLDGNLLRTFATVPVDLGALASGVPGSRYDVPSNLLPLSDGSVLILTARRLHRYDSSGNLVWTLDYIFGAAAALAFERPQPFESAGIPCRPWSVGFWKRQCSSQGLRRAPARTPGDRGGAPGLHPMFRDGRLPDTIDRANVWLAPYGTTACAALQPESPSDWRSKALRRFAAVALNLEDRRIGRRCPVTIDGAPRQVGDVLNELVALLGGTAEDDLKRAFELAGRLLGEE